MSLRQNDTNTCAKTVRLMSDYGWKLGCFKQGSLFLMIIVIHYWIPDKPIQIIFFPNPLFELFNLLDFAFNGIIDTVKISPVAESWLRKL